MTTNYEDIKDLEKYTFSKYWNSHNNTEAFSQFNSFTNNFILNYKTSNNINNKTYNNNNIKFLQRTNEILNNNKEINLI